MINIWSLSLSILVFPRSIFISAKIGHKSPNVLRMRTTQSGALSYPPTIMTKIPDPCREKQKKEACRYPGHKGTGFPWLPVGPECCVFDAFFLHWAMVDRCVRWEGGFMDWEVCSDGYVPNSSRNPLPPSATTGGLLERIPGMGNGLV